MQIQMKNKNEYMEDGRLTVKNIKKCVVDKKYGDDFILICDIHQRGVHVYRYQNGCGYLEKDPHGKKLWLSSDAEKEVLKNVLAFDNEVSEKEGFREMDLSDENFSLFFHPSGDLFDYIVEFKDKGSGKLTIKIFHDKTPCEMIEKLRVLPGSMDTDGYILLTHPKKETISKNPFVLLAKETGNRSEEIRIKIYYHLESKEDCEELSKLTGKYILPPLPPEYDRKYILDGDTMKEEDDLLLFWSGYEILHRPYFAMRGYTHKRLTVNPHTKIGSDAGKVSEEAISFDEFLKLFEREKEKSNPEGKSRKK